MNKALIHQVVVALRNNARQGNAETKVRREVRGGGAKPFRQKGTGRARQGSSREPQMRGGGTVFGPHRRSYRQSIPTKMRRKALCCALSERARKDQVCVLSALELEGVRTGPVAKLMNSVAPEGRSTLLVTAGYHANAVRSASNLSSLTVRTAADVNALDVLKSRRVVVEQAALAALEERLT